MPDPSKIAVPPSTMERLNAAVEQLTEAAQSLVTAAAMLQTLAPNECVLLDNLVEQVTARQRHAIELRDGCEVPRGET